MLLDPQPLAYQSQLHERLQTREDCLYYMYLGERRLTITCLDNRYRNGVCNRGPEAQKEAGSQCICRDV